MKEDWDTRQYLRENTGIIGNASRTFGRQREFMNLDKAGGLTGGSNSRAMTRNYTQAPTGIKPWTSEFQFDSAPFSLNTATAPGVAPDYYRKGPQEVRINSKPIGGALAALGGKWAERIKNKDRGEGEPSVEEETDPDTPSWDPPSGPDRPALGSGPERPALGSGPERPALGSGPERPALGSGPERPALGSGPERPALGSGPSPTPSSSRASTRGRGRRTGLSPESRERIRMEAEAFERGESIPGIERGMERTWAGRVGTEVTTTAGEFEYGNFNNNDVLVPDKVFAPGERPLTTGSGTRTSNRSR